MRVLFCDWVTFGHCDVVEAMNALGHEVLITQRKPERNKEDKEFVRDFCAILREQNVEVVFTSNYAPVVSECCMVENVKYMAWVYDSPQVLLFDKSIMNPCNYVFLFDKQQYIELADLGIETVYYMPLAVNPKRLQEKISFEKNPNYRHDVSFVGALYNEAHNLFDRMETKLDEYSKGYLYGLMNAQRNVYGYFFLDEMLNNNPIVEKMYQAMPYDTEKDSFVTREYVYGHYFLGRKLATIERMDLLRSIANEYKLAVYTTGDTSAYPELQNMGKTDYYEEMPDVFRDSKINLNISLRTIRTGIPMRAFDIMGCGGFLLTNYQSDFMDDFIPGEDFVYYESKQDMLDKIAYYLEHEEERIRIAENGRRKVHAEHSYEVRFQQMFEIVRLGRE